MDPRRWLCPSQRVRSPFDGDDEFRGRMYTKHNSGLTTRISSLVYCSKVSGYLKYRKLIVPKDNLLHQTRNVALCCCIVEAEEKQKTEAGMEGASSSVTVSAYDINRWI